MAARKVLVGFAVLALGVGITASVATAFSPCGYRACSDAVAASGFSGQARGACLRQLMADCRAGLCSCTGGSPPCSCVCGDGLCGPSEDCSTCPQDCGPCPTTTTTTTLPCNICFVTVFDQCLGPCPPDGNCGIEPNVLCLPVTELQSIGVCRESTPLCPPEACECPTSTTTTTTTTTTIATPQCNRDCSGLSCPPGEVGVYLRTQCGCAPEPGCGGSGGVCGGNCPTGVPTEGCHYDTFNFCCLCGGP